MPIIDPNVLAMLPEAQGQTEPTDSQSIWDVLHPSIIQALQGMTQQRPPAESLFFPTTGEGGRPTFLGRHDKLRRGLEAGIMGLMNPPPPGSGGRAHLAQGLRSAFGYDAALQARADAPAQQRIAQLGPMMELARAASAASMSEAQAEHFRAIAEKAGQDEIIYDPDRGGTINLTDRTFSALEGITPAPPETGGGTVLERIQRLLDSDDPEERAEGERLIKTSGRLSLQRAAGAFRGGLEAGRESPGYKNWRIRQDKIHVRDMKEFAPSNRAQNSLAFMQKWNIPFEEAGEAQDYIYRILPIEFNRFMRENDRGSWATVRDRIIADYMHGQRGPEPQAADGGVSVGDVVTVDGIKYRITEVDADGNPSGVPIE